MMLIFFPYILILAIDNKPQSESTRRLQTTAIGFLVLSFSIFRC